MSYYPILIELKEKIAIIVGGGSVAERKAKTLLEYGAIIHIVSRQLTNKLNKLVEDKQIKYLGEKFREEDLNDAFVVIAATDDKELNHEISEISRKRGLLTNAVDQPSDCNFIVPSITKRGDLIIAISTSGKSPALAGKIRKELEKQFDIKYESFLVLMGRVRNEVMSRGLSQTENSQIFHKIIDSPILNAIANKDWARIESILRDILPWDLDIRNVLEGF